MRFASIGSSNFASAGNTFGAQAQRSFNTTRSSSPNMGELANKGQQIRSKEKQAYNKIESEMRQQGIQEVGKHTVARLGRETEEIKRGAKRKAGALATLGKMAPVAAGAFGGEKRERRVTDHTSIDSAISKLQTSKENLAGQMQDVTFKPKTGDTTDSSSTGSTKTDSSTGSAYKPMESSGNLKMDYMTKLTGAGMSDVQAAATVGHMMVETGGFKHMEELAPNVHGTKGYGHLQWTDPGSGGGRRTDFMKWSKDNGLDPQSFEANSGFLVHEMTTNFNRSWTGGGSFEGLQGQNTLEGASSYLQSNYIRPGVPHTERRIGEGQAALKEWRNYQSQN